MDGEIETQRLGVPRRRTHGQSKKKIFKKFLNVNKSSKCSLTLLEVGLVYIPMPIYEYIIF